jgi:ferredoxin
MRAVQGHARARFALAGAVELDSVRNGASAATAPSPTALDDKARLAQANCPEMAVEIIEE